MQPQEQALLTELTQLNNRIIATEPLTQGDMHNSLPDREKELVLAQIDAMKAYKAALKERLALALMRSE